MNKYVNRDSGIDFIKILAAALVIGVHHLITIGFYEAKYDGSFGMILSTGAQVIMLTCVPLFLIVTGYLLSHRNISKNHYTGIVWFFLEVFLIYLFGRLIYLVYNDSFTVITWIKDSIISFLSPSYYVGLYVSLYFISPFLNRLFNSLNDNERLLFIIVILFIISFPKALNSIFKISFFDLRPTHMWMWLYYFIGVYIKEYQPKLNKFLISVLIFFVALVYGVLVSYARQGNSYSYIFGYYENIFTVSLSILLFLLFYKLKVSNLLAKKVLAFLSASTLTFYIFGTMFSDSMALKHISLSGNMVSDLYSVIPKIVLSKLYSLPLALLIYFCVIWSKQLVVRK